MELLKKYDIEFEGLKLGRHFYDYLIEDLEFVENFDAVDVKEVNLSVQVELEMQSTMMVLVFDIKGDVVLPCDICLEDIKKPIDESFRLLFKFDQSQEDTDEIVFLPSEAYKINVAQYIYEFICVSIPLKNTHQDIGEECDENMLQKLDQYSEKIENNDEMVDPVWSALKKLSK